MLLGDRVVMVRILVLSLEWSGAAVRWVIGASRSATQVAIVRDMQFVRKGALAMTGIEEFKRRFPDEWSSFCGHEFVMRIEDGTLPQSAFRHYLKQDYRFLLHFARAWGLAVYKSRTVGEIDVGLSALRAIVETEMPLHIAYCADWGVTREMLDAVSEEQATTAYSRYVLDVGNQGDLLGLHVALAPCILGYAEIGRTIALGGKVNPDSNPYVRWIEMYSGDAFQQAAAEEQAWIDERLKQQPVERLEQLAATFKAATRMEADFWKMGLERS